MKFESSRLVLCLFLETIVLCLITSFRFINIESTVTLLIFTFFYNIPICAKAFLDLLVSKIKRKDNSTRVKTSHLGNGNCYFMI